MRLFCSLDNRALYHQFSRCVVGGRVHTFSNNISPEQSVHFMYEFAISFISFSFISSHFFSSPCQVRETDRNLRGERRNWKSQKLHRHRHCIRFSPIKSSSAEATQHGNAYGNQQKESCDDDSCHRLRGQHSAWYQIC